MDAVIARNPGMRSVQLDVTDVKSITAVTSRLISEYPDLNVLINNAGVMLIDDADKPAKWYFALKQRRLTGNGEHPLAGPVELHWRS